MAWQLWMRDPKVNLKVFLTPIDFLSACVSASVLLISSENISDPPNAVKGVPSPNVWAIPIAIAVFPIGQFYRGSCIRLS